MKTSASTRPFRPHLPDASGVISWVHIGDLHMTKAGEQNHLDLAEIVNEVNQASAGSVSFVFLPGDVADDGSRAAYEVVRRELDRLDVPWCAIVGDHDVHEKTFANFLDAMSERTHYAFTVGSVRFVAMNAFDVPHPASFAVSADQLAWVKHELQAATEAGQSKVLLLHCYPSDLKVGGAELMEVLRNLDVRLIDMGHTHYNEIANNGRTLYSATRSTGQIEEGPVGYSVTNIDGDVVSWRFVELGGLWKADVSAPREGVHFLKVSIEDARARVASDEIRITIGQRAEREYMQRDQNNALEAWPEHGLLGSQLGPNNNGKKW